MQVKIDTKEKFTVVTPLTTELTANIAAELADTCNKQLQNQVKNIILNLSEVQVMDAESAKKIADLQSSFYEKSASFVICSLQDMVEEQLEKLELLEFLNITPTESEAWDIVQMEEIERELLDGDAMEFEPHS